MSDRLTCVLVSFEAVPFAKVGGLADVAGSLPDALAAADVDCRLVIPRFGDIDPGAHGLRRLDIPQDWYVGIDFEHYPFSVWEGRLSGGATVYLVGDERFYGRPGIYNAPGGHPFGDELQRYVFFAKGAVELVKCLDLHPDVIHANDYQTALVCAYVRKLYAHEPALARAALVYSIHNMAYQGSYAADAIGTIGFEPADLAPMGPFELHGAVNLMKVGIEFADVVTTVSPSYAAEIQTPEGGCGLDGVLRHHAGKLFGVLNGIDEAVWNPSDDPHIAAPFSSDDLAGKRECKAALLEDAGLALDRLDLPMIGMVGRLVHQKGIDLVAGIADDLLRTDVNLVLLGSGANEYEDFFRRLATRFPDRVGARIGFDEALAHQITAGSDIFLMPSRYEPCGLNQMYAMRYGAVPVVHRTGGLADTVEEWNPETGEGTGFLFEGADERALADALGRAIHTYQDHDAWSALVRSGMARDFSWARSAARYRELYELARERRRG